VAIAYNGDVEGEVPPGVGRSTLFSIKGREIITILLSIDAMRTPIVVFDKTTHL